MTILELSVRLALIAWLAGPLAACLGRRRHGFQRAARIVWTLGCAAFLVHVAAAFELVHDWSHAAALEETARQTEELTGVASGTGLWLNYLFTVFWVVDVAWWWRVGLEAYRDRSAWIDISFHGFFLFMVFNATVVFETGVVRIGGAVLTLCVLGAVGWRFFQRGRNA